MQFFVLKVNQTGLKQLKFHNAVNLTNQAVKAVFRFKVIGSVDFRQMKNGSSFFQNSFRFLLFRT